MTNEYVYEFITLDNGTLAGCLIANGTPKGYKPPIGFTVRFERLKFHPVERTFFSEPQWWMFLTQEDTLNNIITDVYLSKLSNDEALKKLMKLNAETLAETLLDCFHRGGCRFLFCNADGEPF